MGEYDVFDFILENLSLTAEELKRGEQRRSDFVANVSHELKTPLAIVTNCADVLRQEGLSEERRREYAEILHAAAGRLSALVSNVLKLDKLENGSMPPEAKKFDLGESLAQCVLQFEDAAERKGLNFACEIEEGVELVSDESLLSMIWTNLLSNAVKFTDAGGTVFVTLRREEGGACVEVRDTGCGMSAETARISSINSIRATPRTRRKGTGWGSRSSKRRSTLSAARSSSRARPARAAALRCGCTEALNGQAQAAGDPQGTRGSPF